MPRAQDAESDHWEEEAAGYRSRHAEVNRWADGYGSIRHSVETQARVFGMAEDLASRKIKGDGVPLFELLHAADWVASAAMWLVVHETYARNVYLDGWAAPEGIVI